MCLLDKTMWAYIIKDVGKELEYLPYAILFGLLAYIAVKIIIPKRNKDNHYFMKVMLSIYLFALIHITLFEREPGSRTAVSLILFETFGDSRANAYVMENVLLFMPFGFFPAFLFRPMRKLFVSIVAGVFCSLIIETIQLITQRGYFQLDDILMNGIGSAAGCICFWLIKCVCRAGRHAVSAPSEGCNV